MSHPQMHVQILGKLETQFVNQLMAVKKFPFKFCFLFFAGFSVLLKLSVEKIVFPHLWSTMAFVIVAMEVMSG